MDPSPEALIAELQAVPKEGRLEYLASQSAQRLVLFKRVLPPDDIKRLHAHIDSQLREAAKPTYKKWLQEARDGNATSPDAMIEVLAEVIGKLKAEDASWVRRLTPDAKAGVLSRRQAAVIRAMYARYFSSRTSG